jgi:hypothetical protein
MEWALSILGDFFHKLIWSPCSRLKITSKPQQQSTAHQTASSIHTYKGAKHACLLFNVYGLIQFMDAANTESDGMNLHHLKIIISSNRHVLYRKLSF